MTINNWLNSLADTHTPDFDECQTRLSGYFPWLNDLSTTEQDPIWHAEGNVAIHTDNVLAELYTLLRTRATHICGQRRQALILSALLHDIAKPITTRRQERHGIMRVVAPRHEETGRNLIAIPLMSLPLPYPVIRQIMGLVGFHDRPKQLVLRNAELRHYLQLALNVDTELLYWLETADMLGRTCEDRAEQLTLLDEYRLFAEEFELWGHSDPATSICRDIQVKADADAQRYVNRYAIDDLIHGHIAVASESIARTFARCDNYSRFYLLFGPSGSGKSTWIQHCRRNWVVISLDEIREEINGTRSNQKNRGQMLQLAKSRLKQALAAKQDVVWDATNLREDFRRQLTSIGRDYGALITNVIFHLDKDTLIRQNRARRHPVPDEVLNNQLAHVQWPVAEESHCQLIVGKDGKILAEYH